MKYPGNWITLNLRRINYKFSEKQNGDAIALYYPVNRYQEVATRKRVLDVMHIVIVRSAISPGADCERAFYGMTYIECEQQSLALHSAMAGLAATRVTESPFYLYKTSKPAYVVHNRLIQQGCRVVKANSIAGNGHWQIWTLCT